MGTRSARSKRAATRLLVASDRHSNASRSAFDFLPFEFHGHRSAQSLSPIIIIIIIEFNIERVSEESHDELLRLLDVHALSSTYSKHLLRYRESTMA